MFSNYPVYQKTTDSVSKKGAKAFRGTVVIFMVERERESACSLTRQMPETTDPPPRTKGHRQRQGQYAPVLRLARRITHNPQY